MPVPEAELEYEEDQETQMFCQSTGTKLRTCDVGLKVQTSNVSEKCMNSCRGDRHHFCNCGMIQSILTLQKLRGKDSANKTGIMFPLNVLL